MFIYTYTSSWYCISGPTYSLSTQGLTSFRNPTYHFSKKDPPRNRKKYGVCAFSSIALQLWCSVNISFISKQACIELPCKLRHPKAQGPTGSVPGPKGGGGRPGTPFRF